MPTAPDKLSLIVDALLVTGQNTVSGEDDGSNEWNVSSAGYEKGLRRLLDEHSWKFAKFQQEIVDRTDPTDPQWQDAYTKPTDALSIVRVMDTSGTPLTDWRLVGNKILVNAADGLLIEFIADVEPGQWPGLFVDAQMHFIMASIYRGLSKDPVTAAREEKKAEDLIKSARPRSDSQEPARARFVSSLAAARRSRRG